MTRFTFLRFATLLAAAALAGACGTTAPSTDSGAADPVDVRSGRYLNAQGGWLKVTNFAPGATFDFELSLTAPEDCAGVSMKGQATFDNARVAKTADGGVFKLTNDGMDFEPSTANIGMACARVLDTSFSRAR